jgi:2-keto-4-pentenoate hydratase/2-oxohepta-3-ene-1,7-dioic acid hydratase in catechol pathway
MELPERPLLFSKWPNTVIASGKPIVLPVISSQVDFKAELGVVIGAPVRAVSFEEPKRRAARGRTPTKGSIV